MDRSFDRFFSEPSGMNEPGAFRAEGWMPAIDVSESDGEVLIRAEAPGIAAKDLEITVSGHALVISGKKEETTEKKDENFYHCERRFGSFRRVIDLPDTADTDKVTAEAGDGVVTIHVAKKPGVKARQVEIKSAPAPKKVPVTA
jgi:HSP20 family protein